jgi:hypothetical protein
MPMPRKLDEKKHCRNCGARLHRKKWGGRGMLESNLHFRRRRYCDKTCAAAGSRQETVGRQAHMWRARKHRKAACENCGETTRLQVHHLDRNWTNNDPKNLRTLCPSCHRRLHWDEDDQRVKRRRKMLVEIDAIDELAKWSRTAPLPPASRVELNAMIGRIRGAVASVTRKTGFDFSATPASPSRRRSRSKP